MRRFAAFLLAAAFTNPSQLKFNANTTGSASRKIADKEGDIPSVKDTAGVVGDGVNDDTTGIQAAFNAIPAAGGSLYFPPGTYKITGPLTLARSNSRIFGASGGGSILSFVNGAGIEQALGFAGLSNVEIDHLSFAGSIATPTVSRLITATGCTNLRIHHNQFSGANIYPASTLPIAGIYIAGITDVWIEDNYFSNNGNQGGGAPQIGYDITNYNNVSARVHVRRNTVISYNTQASIAIFNCNSCDAIGNTINQGNRIAAGDNNGYGILFYGADQQVIVASPSGLSRTANVVTVTTSVAHGGIVNNLVKISGSAPVGATNFNGTFVVTSVPTSTTFTYAQTAVNDTGGGGTAFFGYNNALISQNTITNTAGSAIYTGGAGVTDCTISDNTMYDVAKQQLDTTLNVAGVAADTPTRLTVANNSIDTSGKSAISVSNSSGVVISSNTSKGSASYGIWVRGTASDTSVVSNKVNGASVGIYSEGTLTRGVIANNIVGGTITGFAAFSLASQTETSIANNIVAGGSAQVMLVQGGNRATISGNNISGGTVTGLDVSGSNNTVFGNSVHDNGTTGLLTTATDSLFSNNTLAANGGFGIVDNGSTNRFVGNDLALNVSTAGISYSATSTSLFNKFINTDASTFTMLGTPANGSMTFCSNCTIANPCAAAGTGALAKRLNGIWVCN